MTTLPEAIAIFLLGLFAPLLYRFATSFFQQRELYGGEAVLLNLEIKSLWNNMGYWERPDDSFPDACRRLAVRVAQRIKLGAGDTVVDVGSGNGDSLALWFEMGAANVRGVTSMDTQNKAADVLLKRRKLDSIASTACGDGATWLSSTAVAPSSVEVVLSIDAAYHFKTRDDFLRGAYGSLKPSGRLGLTDLIRPSNPSIFSTLLLRMICLISKVPWQNMLSEDEYIANFRQTGFAEIQIEDISANVFLPLATWILNRDRMYGRALGKEWGGLMGFARVLRWWSQGNLKFVVVSAVKPGTDEIRLL